jgi:hypothetical protein
MKHDDWHNLYRDGWQGEIVPEAFAHPAKFSRALIRHIYEHMRREGCLSEGDTVIDPFGGVALGGLDAMRLGLNWIGIELEPKFVDLGNANIALWNARYSGKLPKWGSARIVQGDSRRLLATIRVVREAGAVVSSPPYATKQMGGAGDNSQIAGSGRSQLAMKIGYGTTPGNLGNLRAEGFEEAVAGVISSPPYAAGAQHTGGDDPRPEHIQGGELRYVDYGSTSGQLAALREGDISAALADAAVSSPPFGDQVPQQDKQFSAPHDSTGYLKADYGSTPGNLGNLRAEGFGAAVSSPPYVSGGHHPDQTGAWGGQAQALTKDQAGYGRTDGQLGQMREGEFDAAVSSPPFGEGETRNRSEYQPGYVADMMSRAYTQDKQGTTEGNLAALRATDDGFEAAVDGCVSSPPYAGRNQEGRTVERDRRRLLAMGREDLIERLITEFRGSQTYGDTDGQLGSESGDTFWSAARVICAQTFAALRPGGHAAWTLKAFVRDGARVDFPGQWRKLCESVGFVTLHEHRAWLVEEHGIQPGFAHTINRDGTVTPQFKLLRKERKSFFRRLSESKAQAAEFWKQITRADKARHMWEAHRDLWADYNRRMLEPYEPDVNPPVPATRMSIRGTAQRAAWTEAGKPLQDIDTRIDYEIVLCMQKPE